MARRIVIWFAVASLILGLSMPFAVPAALDWYNSPPGWYLQQESAVARNVVLLENGHPMCSGVLFNAHGAQYVLTAGHCVDGVDEIWVRYIKADGSFIDALGFVLFSGNDRDRDAGLVLLPEEPFPDLGPLPLYDGRSPLRGSDVLHVGNPGGELWYSAIYGKIVYIDRELDTLGKFDQINCASIGGSSGGGVWTLDGRFLGIVVRGVSGGPGIMFINPSRYIRLWFAEKGYEWVL